MCGITGYFHFEKERKVSSEKVKGMANTLIHRGPDGEGFFVSNNIALGHRRLAIIDLTTGDQPMYSEDKNIALVFNGEIYNYIELREELKLLGCHFHTSSDTEVVIKAYQTWGIDCHQKFNGCWAFALWDEFNQQLILSRDRIGEKPLYYSIFDNTIVFGSEIKSLLAYGIPKQIAFEFIGIYLTLGYLPAPYSFFKNIKKLKQGHYLLADANGISEKKYWDLPLSVEGNMLTNSKQVYYEFEYLLKDSVKKRMRSDVPYGAFLSGGLDSSSIVAIMSEISTFPVETFTIGFEEQSFDERDLAYKVALKFKTNHHTKIVHQELFEEALEKVLYNYDEPFGDSSSIPSGYVAKYARESVKMVLTGDGGDEVLSGYNSYVGLKLTSRYRLLPSFLRAGIPTLLDALMMPIKGEMRYRLNRLRNNCYSGNMDFNRRMIEKMAWTRVDDIKAILKAFPEKQFPVEEFINDLMKGCSYKDDFYKMMYLHLKLTLPDNMLVKVDRMTMSHSLEARIPFLDHRLVEYMVNVHKDVKLPDSERKSVLINTIGRKLPDSLLHAPKKGFVVPVREWFKDKSFNARLSTLYEEDYGLDKSAIQKIVLNNAKGDQDNGNFIWMLFVLRSFLNK
jgi:asparagine synthase (glutamine-hydrolysing)